MDDFDFFIKRTPWVNDKFIGPSFYNLLLAYYITQGEPPERAKYFVEAQLKVLRLNFTIRGT